MVYFLILVGRGRKYNAGNEKDYDGFIRKWLE